MISYKIMKKSILIMGLIGMITPAPAQAGWFDTATSWLASRVEQVKKITPSFVSNGWHSLTQAGSSVKKQVEASPATFVAIAAVAGTAVGSLWAAAKSFIGLKAENENLKQENEDLKQENEGLRGENAKQLRRIERAVEKFEAESAQLKDEHVDLLEIVIEGAHQKDVRIQHLDKENDEINKKNKDLVSRMNDLVVENRNQQLNKQVEIIGLQKTSEDQASELRALRRAIVEQVDDNDLLVVEECDYFLKRAAEKTIEAKRLKETLAAVKKEVSDAKAEVAGTLQLLQEQRVMQEQREKELKEELTERAIQAALSDPLERHDLLFNDRDLKAHPLYRYAFDVDSIQASNARKEARAIVERCRAIVPSGESSKAAQETFKVEYAPVEPLGQKYADHGTIILYCIHGTWSNNEEFVGNIEMVNSTNLILAAQQIADAYKKQVIIKTSSWSGALDPNDRLKAGTMLFEDIKDNHSSDEIWMIAHSHGCNAASIAANKLAEQDICIKKGIFIASPTLDQPPRDGKPHNFEHLMQFYGSGDFTQMAGSIEGKYNFDRKMPIVITDDCKVHNVRVQYFGADANHVNIKWIVSEHLGKLLVMLETIYQDCFDLDVDLANGKNVKPVMAIRHPEMVKEDSSKLEKSMKWSRCAEDAFPHLLKTESYKHKYNGKARESLNMHAQTGYLMYGTMLFFNAWNEAQSAGRDGKTVSEFDALELDNLERSFGPADMANSFVDIRAPEDNMVKNIKGESVNLQDIQSDYPERRGWFSWVPSPSSWWSSSESSPSLQSSPEGKEPVS